MSAVFNPTLSAPPTDGLFSLWLLSHSSSEGEGAKLFTRTNTRPIIPYYLSYSKIIIITTKEIVLGVQGALPTYFHIGHSKCTLHLYV